MKDRIFELPSIKFEYDPIEEAEAILRQNSTPEYQKASDIEKLFEGEEQKYLYKDTGFETAKQAEMLLKIKVENPHLTNQEVNEIFANRTKMDFLGYYWEFLARNPFLVNFVEFEEAEIRSSKTGQRLLEVINTDERAGAAKAAIGHLEDHFKQDHHKNTLFAIHSPHGWAQDGYDDYPDDQIYLYHFDNKGKLSAGTMRLSMDISDHESFLSKTIADKNYNKGLSHKEKLISVSSTIVELENEDYEGYLLRLEKHLDRNIAWEDYDKKGKLIKKHTFSELRDAIRNRDELTNLDEDIEGIAKDLDKYLKQDIDFTKPKNLKALIIKMGSSAMDMHYALKVKKGYRGKKDYHKLSTEAKDLGGCVASSSKESVSGRVIIENGQRFLECFCPICDPNKEKGLIKAPIKDNRIYCTRCGASAPYKC